MSITLTQLIIGVALAAGVLTAIIGVLKNHKSWLMTYLQNFTGVLFIFSGMVKAIDPLGTAYKMEQYFDEFYYTFEGTWFKFMAPLFPWLSNYSVGFSVGMIVFEIVLGLALILGVRGKLTSWLFLSLVGFFTFLTGFTYLTGYVPEGGNFFNFGNWGEYNANNMKVTDCGCFGDFLKLEPKVSFFKDVFLLFPAFFFVFRHKDMHQLFTKSIRHIILGISTVGLLIYCFSNYIWDLPDVDFRPFSAGKNVAAQRIIEEDAMASVQILEWILENKSTGEIKKLPTDQYFDQLKTYNKANGWSVKDQVKSEPSIKPSKISEFEISDFEGNDVSYEYLEGEKNNFMVVSHKMYGQSKKSSIVVQDTTWSNDTLSISDNGEPLIDRKPLEIKSRNKEVIDFVWDEEWKNDYLNKIKPLAEEAKKDGHKVSIVFGGADVEMATDFALETGIPADYYTADDILLKTIVRSNPGVVLWKDGKILEKWHKRKLPKYEEIKSAGILK